MDLVGYHASHEQFSPSRLLEMVKLAEAAGFGAAKSSDHFHPWSERQGQSGFAWSWLGAAMQATALPFGIVTAPGYRYHPAILAQAAATLCEMFPRRLWVALGSGEAINEAITGLPWPEKADRNARLEECVSVWRALFAGETVTHRGRVTVVEARLYSRPPTPPPLLGAAVSEATARFVAGWADGLLTVGGEPAATRRVVEGLPRGRRRGQAGSAAVGPLPKTKPRPRRCTSGATAASPATPRGTSAVRPISMMPQPGSAPPSCARASSSPRAPRRTSTGSPPSPNWAPPNSTCTMSAATRGSSSSSSATPCSRPSARCENLRSCTLKKCRLESSKTPANRQSPVGTMRSRH